MKVCGSQTEKLVKVATMIRLLQTTHLRMMVWTKLSLKARKSLDHSLWFLWETLINILTPAGSPTQQDTAKQIFGEYQRQLLDRNANGPTGGDAHLGLPFPKKEELVGDVVIWVLLTSVTMKWWSSTS